MNKNRRDLILTAPALTITFSCAWTEAFACPGMEYAPSEYVSRKKLKNWVPGGSDEYLSKHYPDIPHALLQQPEFSVRTQLIPENNDLIPVKINLPNNLRPISVNGLVHEPNTLKCIGLEVICEGRKIDKARQEAAPTYPTFEIFSNGTYQICSFHISDSDVLEIEFWYRRWEESRLMAIAHMASIHERRSTLALIATTDNLKSSRCGGPVFVDSP